MYCLVNERAGLLSQSINSNAQSVEKQLKAMFYKKIFGLSLKTRNVKILIVLLMLIASIVGFYLPGSLFNIDITNNINKAIILNKEENYNKAAILLEDLKDIKSPLVHNELGIAYLGMQDYKIAELEFKKAIKLFPYYSKPYRNLSILYSLKGETIDSSFSLSKYNELSKYSINNVLLYGKQKSIWDGIILRFVSALILMCFCLKLPLMITFLIKKHRLKIYEEQFADGLMLMSNALKTSTITLGENAFKLVSETATPPLSEEFAEIVVDYKRTDESTALSRLYQRMPTPDTKIFVHTIQTLKQQGGEVTEKFDSIYYSILERKKVQKKIKSMTAQGKAQIIMITVIPVILGLILDKLNHDIFKLMYTTFWGYILLTIAVLFGVIGYYFMYKIIDIKV